jgi:hypothetical protein
MNCISCFVDEAGHLGGKYQSISPYYIVSFVFHNQQYDITSEISYLDEAMRNLGVADIPIHSYPIIRREEGYKYLSIESRRRILLLLRNFIRKSPISYKSFVLTKNQFDDDIAMLARLSKQIATFLTENLSYFQEFDEVLVYYDNGQKELTKLLAASFGAILNNVKFKKVSPREKKLFQVADMCCTVETLSIKAERKAFTKSEKVFFISIKQFKKTYLTAFQKKQF